MSAERRTFRVIAHQICSIARPSMVEIEIKRNALILLPKLTMGQRGRRISFAYQPSTNRVDGVYRKYFSSTYSNPSSDSQLFPTFPTMDEVVSPYLSMDEETRIVMLRTNDHLLRLYRWE
jgi:hypothetical protein